MKRVSFETAKAIKEASYPQSEHKNLVSSYFTGIHRYTRDDTYCSIELENEFIEPIDWIDSYNYEEHDFDGDFIDAPTYFDVWLWLWREKNIRFDIEDLWDAELSYPERGCASNTNQLGGICTPEVSDPEEAVVAAIEYLVKQNLLK